MSQYNIIVSTQEATVVAEYEPQKQRSDAYQSEAALEAAFIKMLTEQGYEYLQIHTEKELIANLRKQLEKLNNVTFTDKEWQQFFSFNIANSTDGIVEKTKKIQEDYVQVLKREDGTSKNIYLIDKKNVHNNYLQVINQYSTDDGNYKNRYDVTILVNGLPLVHTELKRRGVRLKEAFAQIDRYQRDSFWAGSGLFEYIQIFVISNGTHTKYYSNTTRESSIKEQSKSNKAKSKKTSNSFEFTSFWAAADNKTIPDLVDFTRTFLAKHTLLNILTKYCIFTSENLLLVMRPYQIAATEKIINKIQISTNYKQFGTGGFVWHTTGSGKTLTSFKAAQIASSLPDIDKVFFVVDRNDLDYQTIKEYDKFEKGAANGNKNTAILKKNIEDNSKKILVTTIQKLSIFVKKNKGHNIFDKRVVLIFDECHRSQFGEMHALIVKNFKKYHIFGFTGTPIFPENSPKSSKTLIKTTAQAFGDKLHTYTIVDAINDGNVLPFRIDYVNTVKEKDIRDKKVEGIDMEAALAAPARIEKVVEYILDHFDQKTKRSSYYNLKGKRLNGFNSIFAVSSIPVAIKYYKEFQKQLAEKGKNLTVAMIYSYAPNEETIGGLLDEESFDTDSLDKASRDFLEDAIKDYNAKFKTNYSTSGDCFQDYYKDLSMRVKNREVDLLLVVNMFLTGFDATTLNTLWVDKNLKQHGLIQAFSRTNRILNSVKSFGNIVCFRDLQKATDDALSLFGDKDAAGLVLLKTYDDYYYGYQDEKGVNKPGYKDLINRLLTEYPLTVQMLGESAEKEFIKLFGNILRLTNILSSFDQFVGNEIIKPIDMQDYLSIYNDLHEKYRKTVDRDNINDDIIFEMELVKQIEVNIDYILMLVSKYHESHCKDKEILGVIDKYIGGSPELRSKKELIHGFIATINTDSIINEDWIKFVNKQKEADIVALISEEKLKEEETRKFIDNAFRDGSIKTNGEDIGKLMPPTSRFGGGNRAAKKQTVTEKLLAFFEKYFGLI